MIYLESKQGSLYTTSIGRANNDTNRGTMRFLIFAIATAFTHIAAAQNALYNNQDAAITIFPSKIVEAVNEADNKLDLSLGTSKFTATAKLVQSADSGSYPATAEMNKLFFKASKEKSSSFSLINKTGIDIGFRNKKVTGSIYRGTYIGEAKKYCDVNLIHPIGNDFYFVLTVTTSPTKCERKYDVLMESIEEIYKAIRVTAA